MARLVALDELLDTAADDGVGVLETSRGGVFDDPGEREFAGGVVGDGDDGAVGDGGVFEESGFEFGGGDLEALLISKLAQKQQQEEKGRGFPFTGCFEQGFLLPGFHLLSL